MIKNKGQNSKLISVIVWAVTLGAIGFLCGFFGPMVFSPDANLGPMLGIFTTGPVSLFIGLILGLRGYVKISELVIASLIVATVSLSMSMPRPRYIGHVIDAEIRDCKQSTDIIENSVSEWKKFKDEPGWWAKRPGWESGIKRMIDEYPGVVLEMWVYREREIYEQRKPWNRGQINATDWIEVNKSKKYFARLSSSSCTKYSPKIRNMYLPHAEVSSTTPPDILPAFLGLYVLRPVPDIYRSLIGVGIRQGKP